MLVLLAVVAACHRSAPAVSAPATSATAAGSTFDSLLAERDEKTPPDALRLPTTGDDPHNIAIVYGREHHDPGWVQTVAGIAASEQHPEDDPYGFFHADHSLFMRGGILNKEVVRELGNLNTATSYYSHSTYVNEATGTRRVDCSGFVDYAVRRVLPEAYEKVPHPNTQRPLANDWYNYLRERYQTASTQETVRWREIRHVGELRAGDLVVWLRPENVTGDNTGHIMFVLGPPTRGRPGEWLVKVADSTTSPHANDSRGTTRTGVGTGTIGLTVDGWDRPLAYYWRGGLSYTAFPTPIAMGRVE